MKKSKIKFIIESFNTDQSINPKWIVQVTDKLFKEFNAESNKTELHFQLDDKIESKRNIFLRDFQDSKKTSKQIFDLILKYLDQQEVKYKIAVPYTHDNERSAIIELL